MKILSLVSAAALLGCSPTMSPTTPQEPTIKSFDLAGSEWGLAGNDEVFLQFQSDGKTIGHGGCNSFFGGYVQDGSALTLGPIGATKKLCPPAIMQIETRLLSVLDQTRSAKATHLSLILRAADGTSLLTLQRRDWD